MDLSIVPAIVAMLVSPPQGGHGHHRHWLPGEFAPFSNREYREPDLKIVFDGVDLASFGEGATVLCRPSVGCSLKISLTDAGSKTPFATFQANVPVGEGSTGGADPRRRWIVWRPTQPGDGRGLPHDASVELLLSKPSGDPAGTYLLITGGHGPADVDQTYGRNRIDPHVARPMADPAASVTFWLDRPGRVEVWITRQHDPQRTLYDHRIYAYLSAGTHEHRWEFQAGGTPKLVPDVYVARILCTEEGAEAPMSAAYSLFRVVPQRSRP